MKSVISKSVMLGLALVAISGCGTSGDKSGSDSANLGSVGLQVQIANGSGLTLSSVSYAFVGPKTYNGNITAPQNSKKISGRVGNVSPGTYNVTLSGYADGHGANSADPIACTGTASGLSVQAGKAAKANVSIVCTQHVVGQPGSADAGMIDVNGTASLTQVVDGACPVFMNDTASALEIPADGTTTVALTGAASNVSPAANLAWTASSGTIVNGANGSATFTCAPSTTDSVATLTLTISSSLAQCAAVTDQIQIECTASSVPVATGGAPGTGGAPATGGAAPATGGAAPATGGAAPATGGAPPATGGSAGISLASIITDYAHGADTCTTGCAADCSQFASTDATYLALVQCIMPANGYGPNGSCYDYAGTNTAVSCYCGATDTTTCTTTGGIGTCAAQEAAAGMTPGSVLTGFTDTSIQAGKANAYVNCLSTTCGCFW